MIHAFPPFHALLARLPDGIVWARDIIWNTLVRATAGLLERLPFIGLALLVLGMTWFAAKLARKAAHRLFSARRYRRSLQELMERFAVMLAWIVGLLIATMIVFPAVDFATALGAAGLLTVAIGLAFKDIFENFFAGVLLLWRFPFESGDFIECEGVMGKVVDTQLRMTIVRVPSGELIVMPNARLITNPVHVLTNEKYRRVSLDVGVAYGVDVATAVEVIRGALDTCPGIHKEKPTGVYPKVFGESGIGMEVLFWAGSTPMEMRIAKAEAVMAIKKALDDHGLEIPFPYRMLTFKEPFEVRRVPGNDPASS